MDMKTIVTIDLEEYGAEGTIEMGMPSFRKLTEMRNEASRYVRIQKKGDEAYVDGLLQGDQELLSVLMYVKKAPFRCNIEGWFKFCDKIEAEDPSASYRLFRKMQSVMMEFEKVESPFVDSPEAGTESSE